MNTTAKELALGGMFTALGVVLLCLGGVVPLALYACPILASAVVRVVIQHFSKNTVISMVLGHPNSEITCIPPS